MPVPVPLGASKLVAYNPERHHRRSVRLPTYDYSQPGAYFVTIVAQGRECLFGQVANGSVLLSDVGKIVAEELAAAAQTYAGVACDSCVIMPNHLHVVFTITGTVGAIHELPLPSKRVDRRKMLLEKVVGRFKMRSAKRINILRNASGNIVWQRNYYEHIVRDENELQRTREYIRINPALWAGDRENPDNHPS